LQLKFAGGTGTISNTSELSTIIEQAAAEKYDAITFPGYNRVACQNALRNASDAGVGIFLWWSYGEGFDFVDGWVVCDTDTQCRKVTEYMIDHVKAKGLTPKVVIMTMGDSDMEKDLFDGTKVVTDAAGVEFKRVVVSTDSAKQIEAISSAYYADPSWNIWIAHTGEAGVSAATVFKEAGVVGESVFVAGIDGTSTHLACLAEGTNVCLLEQNVYSAGYKSTYKAADWLLNDKKLTQFEDVEFTANAIIDMSNYDGYKAINDIVMAILGDIH